MEVLEKFGTEEQKKIWLEPLLNGEIRSAFAMTEPGVASSDATNICTKIEADGDHYVINGHKWWISGAIRPECKVFVVLGRTSFSGPLHKQQSMIPGLVVSYFHVSSCMPLPRGKLAHPGTEDTGAQGHGGREHRATAGGVW